MPGRSNFVTYSLTETAVYWGNPAADGTGGRAFDAPVELACRWEDRQERYRDQAGEEQLSRAVVYVATDLEVDGVLFRGELAELSSAEAADPFELRSAFTIRRFESVKELSGSTRVRRAWL